MTGADVVIVGGGPAGLASAIALADRGLAVTVLERHAAAPDKACGEGLLPPALDALERLGARLLVDPAETAPIEGIRYVDDGRVAEGRLPAPGGLVVRRTALEEALETRAVAAGADLRHGARVTGHRRHSGGVHVDTTDGPVVARMLIAADGLHSTIRRDAGLEAPARGRRRFGLRRHLLVPAPDHFVEVHFADGVEAYVAASGRDRTGVTFLWTQGDVAAPSFDSLLARFPQLHARLGHATPASTPRGAGPMACAARSPIADRLALVGDAAGYVDAITGEGLSVALHAALSLGRIVPDALLRGAPRAALAAYRHDFDRLFLRYALVTHAVLALAHHRAARRGALRLLAARPSVFDRLLRWAVC